MFASFSSAEPNPPEHPDPPSISRQLTTLLSLALESLFCVFGVFRAANFYESSAVKRRRPASKPVDH